MDAIKVGVLLGLLTVFAIGLIVGIVAVVKALNPRQQELSWTVPGLKQTIERVRSEMGAVFGWRMREPSGSHIGTRRRAGQRVERKPESGIEAC